MVQLQLHSGRFLLKIQVVQRKVPFEDTSGVAAYVQQKVDKEAYNASSWASK